jgi:EAL and modified HD-GYP domain-containing signal transduction protein
MDKSTTEVQQSLATPYNGVVFVSRQPIYTRSIEVFAYELLYRNDVLQQALRANGDKDASAAFLNTFCDVGLEPLVGESLAFININRMFILQDYCKALPKKRVVLEVSPDVDPDESVISALTALRDSGYSLALDDFGYCERNLPLLNLANYFSLDFKSLAHEEISNRVLELKTFKAKAIATNIETHREFETAASMGFEYFRGSCFNKPKLSSPARVPINRLSLLQLVLKLQQPELSTVELEKVVGQDLAISYRLLQYVNSAALSLSKNIESIKHAIQMVGTERIRSWASLLLLSKLDDKPTELMVTAFIRAKMAERLAVAAGAAKPDSYYMVGLFSVVDALLNVSMAEAIQLLPFSKPVRDALVSNEGPMGEILKCVLAYESGNWSNIRGGNLDAGTIRQCYLDALSAARNMPKLSAQDREELRSSPARRF